MEDTKDLMLGDWINTRYGYVQVSAIYSNKAIEAHIVNHEFHDFDADSEIDWFDAIPLTAEILEKNGFINEGYFGRLDIDVWHIVCDTQNVAIFHKEHTDIDIPIKYVHELQHALRLCRIDKEIEL